MYNVKDLILNESYGESYMLNNIGEAEADRKFDELMESLDYSYYKIPFGPDAAHLIQHENNFMIPYSDMVKLCKTMHINSFTEGIELIANHYNIPKNRIEIGIEEACDDDLEMTVNDVTNAILADINVQCTNCWGDEDEGSDEGISLELMYGEDAKLINDTSDTKGVNTTSYASQIDFSKVKFVKTIPSSIIKTDVSMVNVYNKDFDYYIELADLEKYMRSAGIDSIKEAVWNVASHNDIDNKHIIILCEKTKPKKKKNKKKDECANLEAMNMIVASNVDKLNLVWISKY